MKRLLVLFLVLVLIGMALPLSASAETFQIGDVNMDSSRNAKDYMIVKRCALGTLTLSSKQRLLADVNSDSNVNAKDYAILKRAVLGTYTLEGTIEIDTAPLDPQKIYKDALTYTCEIVTYDSTGEAYALGSGFVYASNGLIVTNYHVIQGAHSIVVELNSVKYTVESVAAYDRQADLAVLKIPASGLKAADLATSGYKVGDPAYALGSSQGLTGTFSQGMITYASRVIDGVTYIQHDAALSSGNSGGPLINQFGEVIGVNSFTYEDSQNLNFAVAVSELSRLSFGNPVPVADFWEQSGGAAFEELIHLVETEGTEYADRLTIEEEVDDNMFCYVDYYPADGEVWIGTYYEYEGYSFELGIYLETSEIQYYTFLWWETGGSDNLIEVDGWFDAEHLASETAEIGSYYGDESLLSYCATLIPPFINASVGFLDAVFTYYETTCSVSDFIL